MNYSTIKQIEVLLRINYFASFSCQLALLNCIITYLSQPVYCCVLKCSGIILPAVVLPVCLCTYIHMYMCIARARSRLCLCHSSQSVCSASLLSWFQDLSLPALLSPVLRIVTKVLRLIHFTSFQMKERACVWVSIAVKL